MQINAQVRCKSVKHLGSTSMAVQDFKSHVEGKQLFAAVGVFHKTKPFIKMIVSGFKPCLISSSSSHLKQKTFLLLYGTTNYVK